MPFEIERKFLVKAELLPCEGKGTRIIQAYLSIDPQRSVRVRVWGEEAFLTIKGGVSGISRPEFEYPVPVADALEMMKLAVSSPVEKVRKEVYVDGKKWEIDCFEGANKGLILAEIELQDEDEGFRMPEWVSVEVTGDKRYYNSQLSVIPYSDWK